jgi:hypothetical protein
MYIDLENVYINAYIPENKSLVSLAHKVKNILEPHHHHSFFFIFLSAGKQHGIWRKEKWGKSNTWTAITYIDMVRILLRIGCVFTCNPLGIATR